MRVVRQGVEKQISRPLSRQVLTGSRARGKNEPRWVNASQMGLVAQIVGGDLAVFQQPQDAVVDVKQQPHPNVKHFRTELVVVVQTGEDKSVFGKTQLSACRRLFRNWASRIVRL